MQAIQTTVGTKTNGNGFVKAVCAAKSIRVDWDDYLNPEQNHEEAAKELFEKLKWQDHGKLVSGCLKNGDYVHVIVDGKK